MILKGARKSRAGFFMRRGVCRFGDECVFSHDKSKCPPKAQADGSPNQSGDKPDEQHICIFTSGGGKCPNGDECKWEHKGPQPPAPPDGPQSDARASGIRVMTCIPVAYKAPYHRRVIVVSGANELIRAYNHQWWIEIAHGRGHRSWLT